MVVYKIPINGISLLERINDFGNLPSLAIIYQRRALPYIVAFMAEKVESNAAEATITNHT